MEVTCENCRFEKACMFYKRCNGKVIDCTDFKPKTEVQLFCEQVETDMQIRTNKLYGDITTGYTYRNPESISSDESLPKFPLVEKFCHIHQLTFKIKAISSEYNAYELLINNIRRPFKEMTQTVVIRDGRKVSSRLENNIIRVICRGFNLCLKERDTMSYKDYSGYSERAHKPLFKIDNGPRYEIKDVIFNNPATIVFWSDGTKTVVRCGKDEKFDPEKGLAMAIVKKYMGTNMNKSNYCDIFKKWIPEEKEEVKEDKKEELKEKFREVKYMTVKEFAKFAGVSENTIRRQIAKGQFPKAFKNADGKWMIPVEK